jgi:putative resolvase
MSRKKLSTWAAEQGVHYRTALSWATNGTMPVPVERTPGGHFRVIVDGGTKPAREGRVVLYSRVSSSDQKEDLHRQADRLRMFAAGRGYPCVEVVEEIGSGLNGHRKKLLSILSDPEIKIVVVEHRDRLARFGVEYLEAALTAQDRSLVIVESGEQKLDIVQDFVDVVTCMCARIYGKRASSNRAKRAIAAAAEEGP